MTDKEFAAVQRNKQRYTQTDKGRKIKSEWEKSDKGKKSIAKRNSKYGQSNKGRKSKSEWMRSDKGKKSKAESSLKWAQSDEGKESKAESSGKWARSDNGLKWAQSDEGKKSRVAGTGQLEVGSVRQRQEGHYEDQRAKAYRAAGVDCDADGELACVIVWHSGCSALCCARRCSCRHACGRWRLAGSGGRSSLCFRQHEGMIDHTKPSGVKDLALNVLGTHHDDQHVEALAKEASGSTGSPRMSSSVLQPMAANKVVDALLCPAHQRAPVTVHQSQIEAASRLVDAGMALPVGVNVCTPTSDLLPLLVQPAIVTALTAVYGAFPADCVLQLDMLRAAVELRQDAARCGAGCGGAFMRLFGPWRILAG